MDFLNCLIDASHFREKTRYSKLFGMPKIQDKNGSIPDFLAKKYYWESNYRLRSINPERCSLSKKGRKNTCCLGDFLSKKQNCKHTLLGHI